MLLHAALPPVGFVVDVTKLPPTATHRFTDGHDTSSRYCDVLTFSAYCHASAPPLGFVEVKMLPQPSTATHRSTAGHDTPLSR